MCTVRDTGEEDEVYNDFLFWRRRPVDLNESVSTRDESAFTDEHYWRRRPTSLVGTFAREAGGWDLPTIEVASASSVHSSSATSPTAWYPRQCLHRPRPLRSQRGRP